MTANRLAIRRSDHKSESQFCRVNCQTRVSVESSRFLPSPAGWRAAANETRSPVTLLTYSLPPFAFRPGVPQARAPPTSTPPRAAGRLPQTRGSQAARLGGIQFGPSCSPPHSSIGLERSGDPPAIWIRFSFFLVRRPNLACFGCSVLPARIFSHAGNEIQISLSGMGALIPWGEKQASGYVNCNRVLLFLSQPFLWNSESVLDLLGISEIR